MNPTQLITPLPERLQATDLRGLSDADPRARQRGTSAVCSSRIESEESDFMYSGCFRWFDIKRSSEGRNSNEQEVKGLRISLDLLNIRDVFLLFM